ncbi:hypothetical protein GE061_017673 [Apolygus lucorum]|uniref:Aminopeptidase n=1 Tax=Apolygus lucorum TaxID=248454 RepID=A0A8S9XBI8_APOLU|nr:hypothetical protein GE061_017673 [Apolygus lucorum]
MDTEHNRSVNEESVTISSGNLPTGSYTLVVYFEGKFQPSLEGFYKSSYVSNKTTRWMASTHFETQGARKAFPCFDEPAMRTKLVLELTLPSDLHAVSNMPVFNTTMIENSKKRIVFAESPAMPTYLMAWFVGDATFDALYSSNSNGITYSVYGNVDLKSQGEYASNVTPSVIAGLESFTGVTYVSSGMSQVGQVAIPDFSAGAMENWGLVTYREAYLLYDVVASSVLDKQHILMVIAHELAHQWFGDAVTLDWWSYTWLNEGFARYLQYVVPNKLEPNWMIENQFLTDVFQLSMTADLDSHPLTNLNVTSMDESEDMFDVVTYGKGASILRMFSSILGEESFKQWLNAYLNRVIQRGRVATPDDLFATLPDATLAEKFRPWTELAGHPVVNVSHINGSFLRLSQVKEDLTGSRSPTGLQVPIQVFSGASNPSISFVPLAGTDSPNASNSAYNYSVQSLNSSQEDIWLGQETLDLRFNSTLSGWYLINANSTGYYRVLYDEANWKALRSAISRDELTEPLVRAQLISDALTLMKTGYLRPQVALDFARFLEAEKDLLVWKAALMAFKSIRDHLLEWTDARDALDTFVKNTMDKALTINLVQNEGSHYEKVLLMYIAKQACVYHINLCASLQLLPKDNLTLIESVDRDTDGAAFCELTKNDWGLWDKLFSMYTSSLVPTQKARYLTSLTCTVNSTLQSRLLGYLLQPDIIKLQDFTATFTRICDTKNGIASAMNFIRTNATSFVSRVSSKRNVRKMLDAMSSKLYTNGMFKEMEDLMSQTPVLGLTGEEKSQLFSKARKSAGRRRIVAERVCEGFELTCVPVADPMPTEDVNRATGVAGSLGLLLAAIALYAL